MNNKPSVWDFTLHNLKTFGKSKQKPIAYRNSETQKLYKEVNAFNNRLIIGICFTVLPIILYIMFLLAPNALIWKQVKVITLVLMFLLCLFTYTARYFFIKFEEITDEKDAENSRYRKFETWLFFISFAGLVILRFYIWDAITLIN